VQLGVQRLPVRGAAAGLAAQNLRWLDLAAHETQRVGKTISLAEMTTRKHYPGTHCVDAMLNRQVQALGSFELLTGRSHLLLFCERTRSIARGL